MLSKTAGAKMPFRWRLTPARPALSAAAGAKKRTEFTISAVLVAALTMLLPLQANAEKADRNKPVNVESDTLRVDDVKKTGIYEGNVVLTQGTLLLTADRIEVRQDERGFTSGVAIGTSKPVYFRQKQEGRDEYVEGTGSRLEYDATVETVKLSGSARLKRGEEEVRGNVITYDARSETYKAQGSSPEGGAGRVRAIIKPKQKDAGEKSPAKP